MNLSQKLLHPPLGIDSPKREDRAPAFQISWYTFGRRIAAHEHSARLHADLYLTSPDLRLSAARLLRRSPSLAPGLLATRCREVLFKAPRGVRPSPPVASSLLLVRLHFTWHRIRTSMTTSIQIPSASATSSSPSTRSTCADVPITRRFHAFGTYPISSPRCSTRMAFSS